MATPDNNPVRQRPVLLDGSLNDPNSFNAQAQAPQPQEAKLFQQPTSVRTAAFAPNPVVQSNPAMRAQLEQPRPGPTLNERITASGDQMRNAQPTGPSLSETIASRARSAPPPSSALQVVSPGAEPGIQPPGRVPVLNAPDGSFSAQPRLSAPGTDPGSFTARSQVPSTNFAPNEPNFETMRTLPGPGEQIRNAANEAANSGNNLAREIRIRQAAKAAGPITPEYTPPAGATPTITNATPGAQSVRPTPLPGQTVGLGDVVAPANTQVDPNRPFVQQQAAQAARPISNPNVQGGILSEEGAKYAADAANRGAFPKPAPAAGSDTAGMANKLRALFGLGPTPAAGGTPPPVPPVNTPPVGAGAAADAADAAGAAGAAGEAATPASRIATAAYKAGNIGGKLVRGTGPAAIGLEVLGHMNDYKLNEPTLNSLVSGGSGVDSSLGGTINALKNGDFAGVGNSLIKGAKETAMDIGSAGANILDYVVPGKAPVSTAYNQMLHNQFPNLAEHPSITAAANAAKPATPPATAPAAPAVAPEAVPPLTGTPQQSKPGAAPATTLVAPSQQGQDTVAPGNIQQQVVPPSAADQSRYQALKEKEATDPIVQIIMKGDRPQYGMTQVSDGDRSQLDTQDRIIRYRDGSEKVIPASIELPRDAMQHMNTKAQIEAMEQGGGESRGAAPQTAATGTTTAQAAPSYGADGHVPFASLADPVARRNVQIYARATQLAEGGQYNNIVGGGTFNDFSKHPGVVGVTTPDGKLTAAGAYQITGTTWDGLSKQNGFKDFSPAAQDAGFYSLAGQRGALNDIKAGNFDAATAKLGKEWQGLPSGASKNQGKHTSERFQKMLAQATTEVDGLGKVAPDNQPDSANPTNSAGGIAAAARTATAKPAGMTQPSAPTASNDAAVTPATGNAAGVFPKLEYPTFIPGENANVKQPMYLPVKPDVGKNTPAPQNVEDGKGNVIMQTTSGPITIPKAVYDKQVAPVVTMPNEDGSGTRLWKTAYDDAMKGAARSRGKGGYSGAPPETPAAPPESIGQAADRMDGINYMSTEQRAERLGPGGPLLNVGGPIDNWLRAQPGAPAAMSKKEQAAAYNKMMAAQDEPSAAKAPEQYSLYDRQQRNAISKAAFDDAVKNPQPVEIIHVNTGERFYDMGNGRGMMPAKDYMALTSGPNGKAKLDNYLNGSIPPADFASLTDGNDKDTAKANVLAYQNNRANATMRNVDPTAPATRLEDQKTKGVIDAEIAKRTPVPGEVVNVPQQTGTDVMGNPTFTNFPHIRQPDGSLKPAGGPSPVFNPPSPEAIEHLKSSRDAVNFEKKYGPGSSKQYLKG